MTTQRNNRRAGHGYERQLRLRWREMGFEETETSRFASKKRDDEGVDLVGTGLFNIQAKYTKSAPNMHTLLFEKMPDEDGRHNVVYHKRAHKGETVTMSADDFEELVGLLIDHGVISTK